jgi:uncharacterized protein involved in exopolysaccharide biosynthesis
MSILDFIQLLIRNKVWVIYFPLIVGTGVFFLTHNIPHTYESKTVIYTGIASGYNPDNDFENKIDFHAVNSRFDNLINIIASRETRKDVSLKLLAYMLHHDADRKTFLENTKNDRLNKLFDSSFVRHYKKEDQLRTEEYMNAQIIAHPDGDIYDLLFGEKKNPFNVKNLEDIKAERDGFSDMLKLSYSCEDPLACKKILDITTELFLKKYQSMRVGEANQSVKYFRDQTDAAREKLKTAEDNLKRFRSANGVINYYEQTKYIADQKEKMDQDQSQLEMELNGYAISLARIEQQLNYRVVMELQSEKVVKAQNNLAQEMSRNSMNSIRTGTPEGTTPQIEALKRTLKENIDALYAINNTKEGVPSKNLLDEWLKLTISKEESSAKLNVLLQKKSEFGLVFDKYAPMGSELSKLEREVETAEKEYLALLHNMNQSIQRENNLKVSESISIIDAPDLPVVPSPSKRIVMVVASVLSCIILALVILIVSEYMDSSLGSPLKLEKILSIACGTAFMSRKLHPEAQEEIDRRSLDRWTVAINDVICREGAEAVMLTVPFTCTAEEMTSYVDKLQQGYRESEFALNIVPMTAIHEKYEGAAIIPVTKIFVEQQPRAIMEQAKAVFLFFDASQKLDEYQMQIIAGWKNTGMIVKGVLINCNEQNITKYLGEIPRRRSRFRTFVKKTIKRYANG